jgi:hypothetical protein
MCTNRANNDLICLCTSKLDATIYEKIFKISPQAFPIFLKGYYYRFDYVFGLIKLFFFEAI